MGLGLGPSRIQTSVQNSAKRHTRPKGEKKNPNQLIHTCRSAVTVEGMQRNTCQVHFLNINDLSFLFYFFFLCLVFFFPQWENPSPLLYWIWHLDFLLTETFHPSPAQWATRLCCTRNTVTQLSRSLPWRANVQPALERTNRLSRQRKLQGDSEPRHPNSASVGKKKVKIKVTFRFQSRLEFPRFRLVLIRGLNQIAKLKLPGPLGIFQLWSKILFQALWVWILF